MNVRVGVGVFAMNDDNKFIIGERIGSHGAHTWGLPGGHLEFNESFEECAIRELKEETGLDIDEVRFLTATNDIMEGDKKHYVTIFVGARVRGGNAQPQILEPSKCAEWQWVSWEELGEDRLKQIEVESKGVETSGRRLFLPLLSLFAQREGFSPLK